MDKSEIFMPAVADFSVQCPLSITTMGRSGRKVKRLPKRKKD